VIAIEKDPRLAQLLKRKHGGSSRLRIIEGDVLEAKLPRFEKVVCSPPYYISSRLVLLIISKTFSRAVLTLQKEFAERLAAKPSSPEYGRITVMVQHKSSVQLAGLIRKESFRPVPRVDSAVVVIQRKRPEVPVKSKRLFGDMVRFLFTQRRKKAKKVLRQYLETLGRGDASIQTVPHLPPDVRVFQLTVSDFERLSNEISEMRRERVE
jgi:16S rRNA A1518/A1519 N6-dimethyltransferase RsmA/KsgA/DIM1 with predicted DNA glycosylase/AP lyase activity